MKKKFSLILPDLRAGGAERVAVNIANALWDRGYQIDVVLLFSRGGLLSDLRQGIAVVDLGVKRVRWSLLPLVRYLSRARPSSALVFMWPLTVIALWARRLARVTTRIVVAEHTTWSRSELLARPTVEWQVRTSMHHFFPYADVIVTVSNGAADDMARFARLDRHTIHVVYNPVVGVVQCIHNAVLEPFGWWSGSHKKVLAVGTLKAVKDYGMLLNAFAELRKRVDARLLLLGEGECRSALEDQVRRLGLGGSVFIPGFVKDTAPYYQMADLHVLSSKSEGLPTVLIEALSFGTPVVSTDCPSGPREILVDGRFGQLVPVGDVAAMAVAMEVSLSSSPDRDALKKRAQDFSIEKAVDKYEELLVARN